MKIATATIQTIGTKLRCVKFDKTESPTWMNDGRGWTPDGMVEALEAFDVKYTQVVDHDDYAVWRLRPPGTGRIRVTTLLSGIELWGDA